MTGYRVSDGGREGVCMYVCARLCLVRDIEIGEQFIHNQRMNESSNTQRMNRKTNNKLTSQSSNYQNFSTSLNRQRDFVTK